MTHFFQISFALSDDEGLYNDEVRDYYKYTPPEVIEDILKEILANEMLDAGTRFSCLEVLLKKNVRKLETGMFPQFYYERIVEVIAAQGCGLQHLNLKGVWLKDNPELLCLALNQMDQLRALYIPHIADDEVLRCVGRLGQLKLLDISGECSFTDRGLEEFCRALKDAGSSLNVLDIGSCGDESVSHETVAKIIRALPSISTLTSYSYVGKSLSHLLETDADFSCSLKYVHDTNTSSEILSAIEKTCPELNSLYLDSPADGVLEGIEAFATKLSCLKLSKFQCLELHRLFGKWPNWLHTLKLSLGRGELDLSEVLKRCQELTHVELYKMDFIHHTVDVPINELEEIEVLYSELSSPCLRYVLRCAGMLKKIVIGEEVGITDGDLYRLCADGCLMEVEELWFSSGRYLTANAVQLLMGHCPRLRLLGRLNGWNLSSDDTDLMRALIQSTNSDLTLLPLHIYMS